MSVIGDTITIPDGKKQELQSKLSDLVKNIFEKMKAQDDRITQTEQRLSRLEKNLKTVVNRERRTQVDTVKNIVVVKSKKSKKDIAQYITEAVSQGGGDNLKTQQIALVDIPLKDGGAGIYKVQLKESNKTALFKGLSKVTYDKEIRLDNETPKYLVGAKRNLTRIAYTLRTNHKGLKTKIGLKSLLLHLSVKEPGSDNWITMDNMAANKYLEEKVLFSAQEKPAVIPSVKQLLDTTYRGLEI